MGRPTSGGNWQLDPWEGAAERVEDLSARISLPKGFPLITEHDSVSVELGLPNSGALVSHLFTLSSGSVPITLEVPMPLSWRDV